MLSTSGFTGLALAPFSRAVRAWGSSGGGPTDAVLNCGPSSMKTRSGGSSSP